MKTHDHFEMASNLRSSISRLIRQFRKQGTIPPFSQSELTTMSLLEQYGALLPSELADMEKVSAQAISQILNHLHELNCINKIPSNEDKRKVVISLTEEGTKKLAEIRHPRIEWLIKSMNNTLNKEEIEVLYKATSILHKLSNYDG